MTTKERALARAITWQKTDDVEVPYEAVVDGARWALRLNDFPAEALYTLMIDGEAQIDFDDWPRAWRRPS